MTSPPTVLFLRSRPGCGKEHQEVVHLSTPGPDGNLMVKDGLAALRCGGWWNPFAVEVSTENPEGELSDAVDFYGRPIALRLCDICVKRSITPIWREGRRDRREQRDTPEDERPPSWFSPHSGWASSGSPRRPSGCGCGSGSLSRSRSSSWGSFSSRSRSSRRATSAASSAPAVQAPVVPAGPATTVSAGTYEVGVDIAPGKYKGECVDGFRARMRDDSGNNTIANDMNPVRR